MLLTLELLQAKASALNAQLTLKSVDCTLYYYKVQKGKTVQSFDTLFEVKEYLKKVKYI